MPPCLQVVAIGWFFFLLTIYAIKAFMFPYKVKKDWNCPGRGNLFSLIPMLFMLTGFLISGEFSRSDEIAEVSCGEGGRGEGGSRMDIYKCYVHTCVHEG
jgi:hypothetical protein